MQKQYLAVGRVVDGCNQTIVVNASNHSEAAMVAAVQILDCECETFNGEVFIDTVSDKDFKYETDFVFDNEVVRSFVVPEVEPEIDERQAHIELLKKERDEFLSKLELLGVDAGRLGELVFDAYASEAEDVNNLGMACQRRNLLRLGWTESDILCRLKPQPVCKVLQLMDSEEDGHRRYSEFVKQVSKEFNVDIELLEKQLDIFI